MKKLFLLIAVPVIALVGTREDYGWQWTVRTDAEAGAYRIVLDDAVYQRTQSPVLKDLDVIDAQAQPVPTALLAPALSQAPAEWIDVPWFPLPAHSAPVDIAAISEIATDGSLRRVEMRGEPGVRGSLEGLLLDTSQVRGLVRSLQFTWQAGQAPFDRGYELLASDDLKRWERVEDELHLIDLTNNGQRILRDRIDIPALEARYLRLTPKHADGTPLTLTSVRAQVVPAQVEQSDWQWRTLEARRVDDGDGQRHFEFELDGRFPIARADVQLPGNSSQEWRLEARETADAAWSQVTGSWIAYRLQSGQGNAASPPQALSAITRARHWRLTARQPLAAQPELRLGYRPEVLVFVAQGQPPYQLVAGSARASRGDDAAVPRMLDALHAQHGEHWQPPMARLDAARELAGHAALTPAETPRDWKAWLLWSLLIAGALMVVGFAVSLLRKPAA